MLLESAFRLLFCLKFSFKLITFSKSCARKHKWLFFSEHSVVVSSSSTVVVVVVIAILGFLIKLDCDQTAQTSAKTSKVYRKWSGFPD